jgi:energy-coupling factor transporter ATP-binding protein EcfA2
MRISKIHIQNILGISELDFEPGAICEVTGKNGSGKTSVLEAIKSIISSGHDATLLRAGEKHGEAVIILSDGTEIGKRITAADSDRFVTNGAGEVVKKPATVIASLTDLLAVNPVQFLSAPAKDRARILLETMPLEADVPKLAAIMKAASVDKPIGAGGRHALVVIDAARQAVFETRTGVNRAITEKKGTIAQLTATLPPPSDAEVGDATALMEAAAKLDSARDAEIQRVNTKVGAIISEGEARIQILRDEAEKIAAEFRAKIEAEQTGIQNLKGKAATQNTATREKHAQERAGITAQIATIQETAKMAARYAVTRDNIAAMSGALQALQDEADSQTAALEEIDEYKLALLSELPIPGLTVVEGDIFRDGIPFDRLNEAQRVTIAIDLAKLRAGELKLMIVDGIECMDKRTQDEFKKQIIAADIQCIMAGVTNGEFTVSSTPYTEETL